MPKYRVLLEKNNGEYMYGGPPEEYVIADSEPLAEHTAILRQKRPKIWRVKFIKEVKEFDTGGVKDIAICPHCGFKQTDDEYYIAGIREHDSMVYTCENKKCEKDFKIYLDFTVKYFSTSKGKG